jgi:hypothetical protein
MRIAVSFFQNVEIAVKRGADPTALTAAGTLSIFGSYRSDFYSYDIRAFADFFNECAGQLGLADICTSRTYHQHPIELNH